MNISHLVHIFFFLGKYYYVEATTMHADDAIENCFDKFEPSGSGRLFEPKDMLISNAVVTEVSAINPGTFSKLPI